MSNSPIDQPRPNNSKDRNAAIDQFRGFAILLMILADYLNNISSIPVWLKHAPDVGYTVIDLVAPLFIFAIGLTFGMSFRRRFERQGAWRTYNHFFSRNLALIGLGFLITLGGVLSKNYPPTANWGLLQALGAAGLITHCHLSKLTLNTAGFSDSYYSVFTRSCWIVYGYLRSWRRFIMVPRVH